MSKIFIEIYRKSSSAKGYSSFQLTEASQVIEFLRNKKNYSAAYPMVKGQVLANHHDISTGVEVYGLSQDNIINTSLLRQPISFSGSLQNFDNGVSISGGYEFGDLGGEAETVDGVINYFVGISAPAGPGEIGGAVGTSGGQTEGSTEELMYEAYYSYPLNDGMTITPLVYVKEQATVGTPDQTGIMVKTSFSF